MLNAAQPRFTKHFLLALVAPHFGQIASRYFDRRAINLGDSCAVNQYLQAPHRYLVGGKEYHLLLDIEDPFFKKA